MSRSIRLLVVSILAAAGLAVPLVAGAVTTPPQITTTALPSVIEGKTYPTTTLKVTGGAWPYTWSVVAGSLPYGLKLSSGGTLSGATGYPYSAPIPITVQVKDRLGATAVRDFQIVVHPFQITTATLKNGRKGAYYATTVKTDGGCIDGQHMQWRVWNGIPNSGVLPTGLKIANSGAISGVPKESGVFTFVLHAYCPVFNNGEALRSMTLTVS